MKIKVENVKIDVEVILFNDENEKVIIVSKGDRKLEYQGKKIIPSHLYGRMISFPVNYEGETYKSFVVGRDKHITAIGHVIDNLPIEKVLTALEENNITYVNSDEESDIKILFIE